MRIIVINVNCELKLQIRFLNILIYVFQFPIILKIVRIGYLLQNFKKALIQNVDQSLNLTGVNRPCRAEICWCGAADVGLWDVRNDVRLWGLKCEIKRHAELSAMEDHKDKSAIEISEMVLAEQWDIRKRDELHNE